MSTDAHDDCWKMLPWLVTGRLSANDMQRVERHLEDCAECRAELAEQRELCTHIRRDEPVLLAPQASLQKLMSRIDSAPPANSEMYDSAIRELPQAAAPPTRSYRWLAVAAAVQTIAIAFLLTLVVRQTAHDMTAPRFTTLTSPSAVSANGAILRVVFKTETPAGVMQSLLHSVNAQVVSGPTEAGVYTLRLEGNPAAAEIATALSTVRNDGSVLFAEHVSVEHKP